MTIKMMIFSISLLIHFHIPPIFAQALFGNVKELVKLADGSLMLVKGVPKTIFLARRKIRAFILKSKIAGLYRLRDQN